MISKVSDSFPGDNRSTLSFSSSLRSQISSFLDLSLLILIFGSLGWFTVTNHSPISTILLMLATAGVRSCWLAGFPVWAGLLSLTFSASWILVGALTDSGIYGWAVAIALSCMSVFLLDISLSHLLDRFHQIGWRDSQIFGLLAIVCTFSATVGGILPILWKV
ncbi:hypothetical protein CEN50_18630 [Fischerella thermalis CCMEE 5268]|uniref:Uncharacterized protein n=1 Tax=Fischerella thermalis CCMEE 5268 TaxID=2019662 RepID=A0A2N6KCM0_9CYAN|nr:hypothetical protein [Fischerella thermalis]PLZ96451.1 hypothetical protein CEN50_18630 [Fischerella thermalis CCMEE 5268]